MEIKLHIRTCVLLLTAAACAPATRDERDTAATPPGDIDCEAFAIRGADGNPDQCDVDACNACVDGCETFIQIWESYPPIYTCIGDPSVSFSVFDFCPDWMPPTDTAN